MRLRALVAWLGHRPLTAELAADYTRTVTDTSGKTSRTQTNWLSVLHHFGRYLKAAKLMPANPYNVETGENSTMELEPWRSLYSRVPVMQSRQW